MMMGGYRKHEAAARNNSNIMAAISHKMAVKALPKSSSLLTVVIKSVIFSITDSVTAIVTVLFTIVTKNNNKDQNNAYNNNYTQNHKVVLPLRKFLF